jgi:4-hydroxy-tetrahydrodipicolinate reductase
MADNKSEMRLVVAGAGGRMGRTLVKAIAETKGLALAGALEDPRSPLVGWDAGVLAGISEIGVKLTGDAETTIAEADGVIDFTAPAATLHYAEIAAKIATKARKVHVIGTTGMSAADEAKIVLAAKTATIVQSGNMSLGVNLLAALSRRVAKTLDDSFDIEIVEMHHNQKVDAPSGTALLLGRAAAEGRGVDLERRSIRGRDGHTGKRNPGDIGFASLRGGTVVGEHTVMFAGPAERIELVHKAEDRMIFARGALHAALWARGQKPGLYSMADVLELKNF